VSLLVSVCFYMPKKGLHLPLRQVRIWYRDGSSDVLNLLVPTSLKQIVLNREPSVHPAWTGEAAEVEEDGQRSKFEKKFGPTGGFFESLSQKPKGNTKPPASVQDTGKSE